MEKKGRWEAKSFVTDHFRTLEINQLWKAMEMVYPRKITQSQQDSEVCGL